MSDADITPVVHAVDHERTDVSSNPRQAIFFTCPPLVNVMRQLGFSCTKKVCLKQSAPVEPKFRQGKFCHLS